MLVSSGPKNLGPSIWVSSLAQKQLSGRMFVSSLALEEDCGVAVDPGGQRPRDVSCLTHRPREPAPFDVRILQPRRGERGRAGSWGERGGGWHGRGGWQGGHQHPEQTPPPLPPTNVGCYGSGRGGLSTCHQGLLLQLLQVFLLYLHCCYYLF